MLGQFINFVKGLLSAPSSPSKVIVNVVELPPPPPPKDPIQINFIVSTLCPPLPTSGVTQEWVNVYLKQFKTNVLLLWADHEDKLNVAFSHNKNSFHLCLNEYRVEKDTGHVIFREKKIDDINDIYSAIEEKGFYLSENIILPTLDELLKHQFNVNLTQKHITSDMIARAESAFSRVQNNLEQNTNCSICLEKYTEDNPAHILILSRQFYHKECITEALGRQKREEKELRDPLTNELIAEAGARFNIKKAILPAEIYQSMVSEYEEYFVQANTFLTMVKVLAATKAPLSEGRKLDEKIKTETGELIEAIKDPTTKDTIALKPM